MLPLAAAAALAWIVSAGTSLAICSALLCRDIAHYVGGRSPVPQFFRHKAHRFINVVEEYFVTGTEIIQSVLAVWSL